MSKLEDDIEKARSEISHGCDGPITLFVLISRAMDLVANNRYSSEAAANALFEELIGC